MQFSFAQNVSAPSWCDRPAKIKYASVVGKKNVVERIL
jgi:hypothetical protein